MKSMTADELREYREKEHEKSYLLIDVRQPNEYEESHISGSIILPLNEFEEQVEELPEKNLIFYCRSGIRSKAAAITADFFNESKKDIYTLEGGILGWQGITVTGLPCFKTFDLNKELHETLLDAINLEKGAFRFYEHILNHFDLDANFNKSPSNNGGDSMVEVIKNARDGELGHAKLIYSHLKKILPNDQVFSEFDTLYEKLKGDILEGGATFDEMVKLIENRTKDQNIDILEVAISMEYRAFDLYRVISERVDNGSLKDAFYSLSQAEKSHMDTLIKALERATS
ncbi:MAG: hypothetical protein HQK74_01955 [Desulfamplus sp.]|nr:hypothetical protein [Desulfamplus sp.]